MRVGRDVFMGGSYENGIGTGHNNEVYTLPTMQRYFQSYFLLGFQVVELELVSASTGGHEF